MGVEMRIIGCPERDTECLGLRDPESKTLSGSAGGFEELPKANSVSTLSIPRASARGVEWVDFPKGL